MANPLRPPKQNESSGEDDWLATYADAVTLVLCFFVILFSMSEPKDADFKKVAESLANAGFVSPNQQEQQTAPVEVMKEEMEIMIESSALEQVMSVEKTDKGIQLELSSGSFYQSGSAKFQRESIPILLKITEILKDFDFDAYDIHVEGHTDDSPIKSDLFPSNWELSAARAANIVRFFIANGMTPQLLSATGRADTKPKVPNLDAKNNPIPKNRELNRRIVIKIERVD